MFTHADPLGYDKKVSKVSIVYRILHGLYGAGVAGGMLYYYLNIGIIDMFSMMIAFLGVFFTLTGDIYVLFFQPRMQNRMTAHVVLFFPFNCGALGCWLYGLVAFLSYYQMYLNYAEYRLEMYVPNWSNADAHGGKNFYRMWIILVAVAVGIPGISCFQSIIYMIAEGYSRRTKRREQKHEDAAVAEAVASVKRIIARDMAAWERPWERPEY